MHAPVEWTSGVGTQRTATGTSIRFSVCTVLSSHKINYNKARIKQQQNLNKTTTKSEDSNNKVLSQVDWQ